ncbi:MAG: LruC domain-containing protein [Prevotellaceae bacterium]|jgi:LruC domain-containing protein|nr:LruC domain-containing protein [Prevotellaceae bacterium]
MRLFDRFTLCSLLTTILLLSGCIKDNAYDPNKKKETEPASNPFGEGFAAPDGFDWAMIRDLQLTAAVNDEFGGQYRYLVEVFTSNPLTDPRATPVAAGVATGNSQYATTLTIPVTAAQLYIRQTDPGQRREVYAFAVPASSNVMHCKLYPTGTASRTRATESTSTAYEAAKAAGHVEPAVTEETLFADIPTTSDAPENAWTGGMNLADNSRFIIGTEFTDEQPFTDMIYVNNGHASIYVKGVWQPAAGTSLSKIDVYVLAGGKIKTTADLSFDNTSSMAVQTGGIIDVTGKLTFHEPVYNYGRINGGDIVFYSADKPDQENDTAYILNHGTLTAGEGILLSRAKLFNHAGITFGAKSGRFSTSQSNETVLVNHEGGTIQGYEWGAPDGSDGSASVYNDGVMELARYHNPDGTAYNSCLMIVTEGAGFKKMVLDNGSLTAGRNDANEWLPVPRVTLLGWANGGDPYLEMKNGSLLKTEELVVSHPGQVVKGSYNDTADLSMVKAGTMALNGGGGSWDNYTFSKVILECDTYTYSGDGTLILDDTSATGYDESKYIVETCGGTLNPGNPGGTPTNPTYPIVIQDATCYSFAFEDLWPIYGDYDLNDLIVTLDKINLSTRTDGSVERAVLTGNLQAVGASKQLGLGIRFLSAAIGSGTLSSRVQGNAGSLAFEAGQSLPTVIICQDAHRFMGNDAGDHSFINASSGDKRPEVPFELTLDFAGTTVKPADFSIGKIDMFIISREAAKGSPRIEVHVAGYPPTDLADTKVFGTGNDNSAMERQHYYLSHENLAWGVVIPDHFDWPLEAKMVTNVYPDFAAWVTSGGKEAQDWYLRNNGEVFTRGMPTSR